MRRFYLAVLAAVPFLAAGTAGADEIMTYSFAPGTLAWVSNDAGANYPADGGYLYGSFTFNWTTQTVTDVNITSSAPTTGPLVGQVPTVTYTDAMQSWNGNYYGASFTYGGVAYPTGTLFNEIVLLGSVDTFVDFTQLSTTVAFPGQLTGVHTSSANDQRVLAATVQATLDPTGSTSVPEPASLLLFGAGLAGLCAVRRRNQA